MIKLGVKDIGEHIVRFYPHIDKSGKVKQSVQEKECYWAEGKEISKNEYWNILKTGGKAFQIKKWFSYADVDGVFGLFQYGRMLKKLIQCCMDGEYYISDNGWIYAPNALPFQDPDTPKEDRMKFKLVTFKPFNIFDLQSDIAIKFEIKEREGFADFCNFQIIHDPEYIMYKPTDDEEAKQKIKEYLTSNLEELPETLISEKS